MREDAKLPTWRMLSKMIRTSMNCRVAARVYPLTFIPILVSISPADYSYHFVVLMCEMVERDDMRRLEE